MILSSRAASVNELARAKSLLSVCAQVLVGLDGDLRAVQAMLALGIADKAAQETQKVRDVLDAVIHALEAGAKGE